MWYTLAKESELISKQRTQDHGREKLQYLIINSDSSSIHSPNPGFVLLKTCLRMGIKEALGGLCIELS